MGRIRGVHAPHMKNTAGRAPEPLPVPSEVRIPTSMHSGAPAKPVVRAGDEVRIGQIIADADGFVSSPVHSSVSGKVKEITGYDDLTGRSDVSIVIETDGLQTLLEGLAPPVVTNLREFLGAVRDSGAVGLGGAGYPTAPKLRFKETDKLDYILINGAECEPYVTSDTHTMTEDAEFVHEGVAALRRYLDPGKIIICVEKNKPEAIAKMKAAFAGEEGVEIRILPSAYPQGERKVLVYNVTGRIVPEGGRLINVGCTVLNCTTVSVFGRYLKQGMPLTQRVVTVDGPAVKSPKNVIAPIGTPIRELFEFCGGFTGGEPRKILAGGPMMGVAVPNLDVPVVKTTNSILAFAGKQAAAPKETACVRCGRCVRVCPMKLSPLNIETAFSLNKREALQSYKVGMCIECGSCAYSCPAKRPLVQVMQLSKALVKEYAADQKSRAAEGGQKEAK